MNTKEIYNAQLNVSKFYNTETIQDLLSRLSYISDSVFYNIGHRAIVIKNTTPANEEDDYIIKEILKQWLRSLPADYNDIETMIHYSDYIFNITKLGYPNLDKHDIIIYLH